ncbi:hypothetical protein QR680_010690 [Steinernema hermaphroditum]|uniref:G-protein coupled receptors family 2 profile 2 domain-containing protein n=1 Tax=Steinernema hermaphroditum TaxID=289476 RepID=A0AA39MC42_9BILA|nr:hypothetical protein QR680_010690 [Steinernema hermaphroditum]
MFVLLMLLLLCPHALFVPFYNNMYFAYFDPNNPSNDFYFERTYLPSSNTYLYSPVDPETFPGSVIVTVTTRSSDGHKANIVYILSTTENTTVSVSSAEFVLTKFDSFQLVHSVEDGQNGEMKFKGCNKYSITCGPPSAADCEVQCDDYHICACIEPSCLDVCWTKYGPPKITNPATSPETTTSTPSTTSTSTTQTTPKQSSSATTGTSTSTTFTTTSSVSSSTSSSGTLPHTTTKSFFFSNSTDAPEISYPNADQGLKNLTNETITPYNVRHVLNQSLTYAEMGKDLNADDVTLLSLIVRNASMLSNISHNVATLLLENVDYMQGAALETFAESNQPGKGDGTTQRIVNAVHNMVQNLQDSNFDYMTGQQLGLRAINKDNHDDDLSIGHDGEKFDSKPGDNSVASITIPKAAMDGGGRVYVAYWATNKLFIPKRITYTRSTEQSGQYITSLTHAEKCSQTLTPTGKDPVLTGTILDKSSTNSAKLAQSSKQLQAVITYDKKKALHPLHGEYKVTWWDKYFSQWARDEQCEMVSNTGRIVAHCYHLTDFTLVEDGMQNDPLVCSVPLQAIAYTLNVLSIVSLIVFMTIRATRYLRRVNQEQPSTPLQKILLNKFLQRKNANEPVVEDLMYTLFLFLFYLFFTCFKDQRVTHNGCEAMGGIAYFLFLCIPFQVFVFAIGDVALRLSYKKVGLYASPATALGVSIGLSFVITVGLGAGSDFFKRNDQFCWIRPTYVVPGIVLPLVFIFTTGIMSTACVAWAFFESRNQNNDLNSWQTRKERLLRITRIVQMQLHLGLPWIFQFASLAFPYVTAWHYLFAFTNDSQGIIHLLIFFLFDKLEAVRKDYEENRSEVDAKQVMEQEKNDRDLLENYYHKEETSVKRRTQIEFTSYAETIEEPYYSRPAATSTPVAHQKSVKTTLYDEPPGETYPEILKRISLEDRQRNSRMIELKSMDFSVEDELWDEEDLEQDTADPEQGNDSTTESSKSDGLGADEAFVNDTVDCTNSTNSGGDGDDAGTAEQNVNEPEQDGNSTTESLDSSEVELSEDNPIDYTNSTDSDGSEDENGADDAANDDGTAPEYEVIQTNPSEPEVHSPLKLKAHENAEEELNWLAGRVTDRAKDDGYDVPSKSEPTSTRNLKTESKMEDDGDLTELPQKTIIDRLPSYKPPSPPPLSTMPAITYLPLITTEPPSDDENPNVKRRWKDHLQRQDSIDESDVE